MTAASVGSVRRARAPGAAAQGGAFPPAVLLTTKGRRYLASWWTAGRSRP